MTVAIADFPDSVIIFYQKVNEKWTELEVIDNNRLQFSFISFPYLNGDKYNDIRISNISGAAGNTENRVLIFNQSPYRYGNVSV